MHTSLLSGKTSFPFTTQKLFSTCMGVAGETDLRAHRSRQFVARVLVITGHMECDFVALVRACVVAVAVVAAVVARPAWECSGRPVNAQGTRCEHAVSTTVNTHRVC